MAKTGGLADVSAALPAALGELGVDIRVLMPAYPQALEKSATLKEIARFKNVLGVSETRLLETRLPQTGIPVWLVDCPELYNRSGGPYQDEAGSDWSDNNKRFGVLNHVAARIVNEAGGRWKPDLLHANDWHAGLLPLLLSRSVGPRPASLFTIHNLAYQGLFPVEAFEQLELPPDSFSSLEFWGRISFLKAGIASADAITTVSPTYAREILTPEYGCGLDGLLRERAGLLSGILNGADYGQWNPSSDSYIAHNYSTRAPNAKVACKYAIQSELGLPQKAEIPLHAYMSRLVLQKMPDTMLDALPSLLDAGMQFALVAEGDNEYQNGFAELAQRYPDQVGVHIGYYEALAHRLVAGSDMLLHPSRFEPCGLVPIYAMRYGTIPIVRRSGGMADTVRNVTPETLSSGTATGFSFDNASVEEFLECIQRAVTLYRRPIQWRKVQLRAMHEDFSWRTSARQYASLYGAVTTRYGGSTAATEVSVRPKARRYPEAG